MIPLPANTPLDVNFYLTKHVPTDPRRDLVSCMAEHGFTAPKEIIVGKMMRFDAPEDKPNKGSGWLIYHELNDRQNEGAAFGIATFGSWKSGEKVSWTSKAVKHMTPIELMEYKLQIAKQQAERDAEEQRIWLQCETESNQIWPLLPSATRDNAYLAKKQLEPIGEVREDDTGALCVPVMRQDIGEIERMIGFQRIWTDAKRFKRGTRKKGAWYRIDGHADLIYIAEGYATAVSIHLATGATIYVAFDAGNLYDVAVYVKDKHQGAQIVIAADNDTKGTKNTGVTAARQIQDGLSIPYIIPPDGHNDFDDWRIASGIDALRAVLEPSENHANMRENTAKKPEKPEKTTQTCDNTLGIYPSAPSGFLARVVEYYNATSGNNQPLFAIQTAIALSSLVLGRSFISNYRNSSMLYLLNVGDTGTGKEHARFLMHEILTSAGLGELIAGSGYTSSTAVFSTLLAKPKHLTIIDEFGFYLESANAKNNTLQKMANSELMQVFGGADGCIRPKNYATMKLSKEEKTFLEQAFVHYPHITMLAMATPDNLFANLGIEAIKSGFLNRILVCISDAKRTIRRHKERMPVPDSILSWIAAINARVGETPQNANEVPDAIQIHFSPDADQAQEEHQQKWIDIMENMASTGMADIGGRSTELAMRLALITALAENPLSETIERHHFEWAASWIDFNLMRLITESKIRISGSGFESQKKEALQAIRAAGEDGIKFSQMQSIPPFSRYTRRELTDVLAALEDANLIAQEHVASGGKGRPARTYYATRVE